MKKILPIILTLIICISLTACGSKRQGQQEIENYRKSFSKLESAHIIIKDTINDKTVQDLTFKYDGKIMVYSYLSAYGEEPFYEFNDGKKLYVKKNDKLTEYSKGKFKVYTKKEPHPNASEQIFFLMPKYITMDAVTTTEEGTTTITYIYDTQKLSKVMKADENQGTLKSFITEYAFDKDGNFLYLDEKSTFESDKGETKNEYRITVGGENKITEVVNSIK